MENLKSKETNVYIDNINNFMPPIIVKKCETYFLEEIPYAIYFGCEVDI